MTTAREKIDQLLGVLSADTEAAVMRCDECREPADLICVDCEDAFCPEHLHTLGAHWASVVCGPCMDREMAAAS